MSDTFLGLLSTDQDISISILTVVLIVAPSVAPSSGWKLYNRGFLRRYTRLQEYICHIRTIEKTVLPQLNLLFEYGFDWLLHETGVGEHTDT